MTRIVEGLLGTRVEIGLGGDVSQRQRIEDVVIAQLRRLERIFTVFDPTSALRAYVRTGTTDVPELLAVIDLARLWWERSAGAFHPGVQALMDVWDAAERDQCEPGPELEVAVQRVQADPPPVDNLNAIAKGWAVDRAVDAATATGATSIWLNVGGDVLHRGTGSVGVALENPHRPYDNAAPLATIQLCDAALATSGGSRRWWSIGAGRYAKLLDPRTGRPVDHLAAATVVAGDAATADVLATAALVASEAETLALVAAARADCLLVRNDGGVVTTSDRFELR